MKDNVKTSIKVVRHVNFHKLINYLEKGSKIVSEKITVKYTDIIDAKTGEVVRTTKQSCIPDDDQRMDEDAARLEKLGRFNLRRATKDND